MLLVGLAILFLALLEPAFLYGSVEKSDHSLLMNSVKTLSSAFLQLPRKFYLNFRNYSQNFWSAALIKCLQARQSSVGKFRARIQSSPMKNFSS